MILTVENSKTTKNYIYGVVGLIVLVLLVSVGAIYYNANKENRKYGKLFRTFTDEVEQGNFKSSLVGLIIYLDTFIDYDSTLSVVTITKDVNITNDLTIGNNLNIGDINITNGHLNINSNEAYDINDISLDLYPNNPNKYGFGMRSYILSVYTNQHFRLYNTFYGDKTDNDYMFDFDTWNKNATINSNTTINGNTNLRNTIYTDPILSVYSPVSDGSTNSPVSLSLYATQKQHGFGIASGATTYFSNLNHKWYAKPVNDNSFGTLLATLNSTGLNIPTTITIGPNANQTSPILSIYSPISDGSTNSPVSLSMYGNFKHHGFGIASSTLNYFSFEHHKFYAKPVNDNGFGTLLATLNSTGLNIPESLTVGANAVILGDTDLRGTTIYRGNTWSAGYYAHKYNGGNSTFAIYSNFALIGDGVSMGYNAYIENGAWVYPNGAANSRMHLGYGLIQMSFGTGSAGGPAVFTANGNGVYIAPSLTVTGLTSVGASLPAGYDMVCRNRSNGKFYYVG